MKRVLLAAVFVSLALLVGLYVVVIRPALAPSDDAALAERALVTPDVAVLAHVNVHQAVFLERWFIGSSIFGAEGQEAAERAEKPSLLDDLRAAGIDPRRDLDDVLYGLYPADGGVRRQGIVLLGRFDPGAIGKYLMGRLNAVPRDTSGRTSYEVERSDPNTCGAATRWIVTADARWILIADPASHAALLVRLTGEPADAAAQLAWWRPLAHEDVLAVAVPDPATLGSALTEPLLQASAHAVTGKADAVRRAYLGLGVKVVPPRGRLRLVIDTRDASGAAKDIERLQQAVAESQARWADTMPTVAALYRSLRVRSGDGRSIIEFAVDRALASNLRQVVNEALGALLGGFGVHVTTPTGAPESEHLEEHPATFQASIAPSAVPAYDPRATFAEQVEQMRGPFGLRIEGVRLGTDPDVGLELTIDGFTGGIPNVTGDGDRVRLFVDSVKSTSGRELVRPEPCGKDRNALPAPFKTWLGERLKAEKTVRLVRDADAGDIGSVSGHVELSLPTRTEAVTVSGGGPASTVRRDGTTFAVPKIEGESVSYQIAGARDRVLALRGLNGRGQPLAQQAAYSSDFLFGEGVAGEKSFAGKVDRVEVVFATETQKLEFPFTLTDVSLSGTPGHVIPGITPTFRPYAYATLQREGWRPLPPRGTDGYRALARLDPYEVSFDRAQAFYLLKLDFTVRSPDLPDLRYAFSPARLDLKRIELKDGTVLEPPAKDPGAKPSVFESIWSRIVRFESSPKDGALATPLWILVDTKAKPEELQSLQGTLTVRFPKVLDTLRMSDLTVGRRLDAGGMTITVAARGRGSLTLRTDIDGDQIMYVRLLNGDGQAVYCSSDVTEGANGAWSFNFSTTSPYSAAEIVRASEFDTRTYPFALDVR